MTVLDKKSKESGQKDFQLDHQEIEILPEEGLDAPYLVRQLLDVVPNPWQGMRLLEETLGALRASGVSEEQIYIKRMVDPEQCFTYCHCTETLI